MQKSNDKDAVIARINGDIITVMKYAENIGWKPIREQSISRILYLSSVLFSFRHGKEKNPFADDYHFSIDATGPFYALINNSMIFLESNGYIEKIKKNEFKIGSAEIPEINKLPDYDPKSNWLQSVFYILGIYGESRIYEFIIRDPQYQEHLQSNDIKELNLDRDNKTIKFLNEFKQTFEETLGKDSEKIDDKEYLELYFEYIFSKVLKGDIE